MTTLTLSPGETILSKAAGDTVRWQIGEPTSGSGSSARTHVMLKPLERGLEANLILTASRRVYLIDLWSGGVEAFNAAVAWDIEAFSEGRQPAGPIVGGNSRVSDPVVTPQASLEGRYPGASAACRATA